MPRMHMVDLSHADQNWKLLYASPSFQTSWWLCCKALTCVRKGRGWAVWFPATRKRHSVIISAVTFAQVVSDFLQDLVVCPHWTVWTQVHQLCIRGNMQNAKEQTFEVKISVQHPHLHPNHSWCAPAKGDFFYAGTQGHPSLIVKL